MKVRFLDGTEREVANLCGANLRGADFRGANLYGANLRGADLRGANLRGACLLGASLREANLLGANLREADLREANLRGADLRGAYLRGADLREANLRGANLRGADLRGADLLHYAVCPEVGAFRAFKKLEGGVVAELGVPRDALRTSSLVGRKCRASKVRVLRLYVPGSDAEVLEGCSQYDSSVVYRVGEYVVPDSYDPDPRVECTHGVHFFITRNEAEEY